MLKPKALNPRTGGQTSRTFEEVILEEGTYQAELLGIEDRPDKAYLSPEDRAAGKVAEEVIKASFHFVILQHGGAEAFQSGEKAQVDEFRKSGHGKYLWLNVTTTISPPADDDHPKRKESNLHAFLKKVLFLPGVKSRDLLEAEIDALMTGPAAAVASADNPRPINDAQIAVLVAGKLAENTAETAQALRENGGIHLINRLVGQKFFLYVEESNNRNKILRVAGKVPAREQLPSFERPARVKDPREDNDDPTCLCADCGETITGYENNREGRWFRNTEAAADSAARYGKQMCGPCIGRHKRRGAAKAEMEELPF